VGSSPGVGSAEAADDAPRRAAGRAAFEATRPYKDRPVEEVRAVLMRELAARGIDDLTPLQLDVLVQAVASPRLTALRVGFQGVQAAARLFRELKSLALPRWAVTPDRIPSISWREDQEEVSVVLECDPAAQEVVARLFAELPRGASAPEESDHSSRGCDCWFSVDGPARVITVRIGRFTIARLRGEHAETVRALIAEHGGRQHAVGSSAMVYGDDPDTGSIVVFFPNRP
jgi:hypothetical protein